MTVESFVKKIAGLGLEMDFIEDSERIVCQWFENNKLQSNIFPISSITLVDDNRLLDL